MNEEIYQQALAKLSIVVVTDNKGIIIYANENFCCLVKYTVNQLIGQSYQLILDNNICFSAKIKQAIATNQIWRGEMKIKAQDGTCYWTDTSVVPLRNDAGELTGYFSSSFDITRKKEAEEELNRQINKNTYIIGNNADAFVTIDNNWQITSVNKALEDVLGLKHDQIIGHDFLEMFKNEIFDHAGLPKLEQALQAQKSDHFEFYSENQNRWYEMNIYPASDGLAITARDISERKKLAEKIRQSEQILWAILQNTQDVFLYIQPDYAIASFNKSANTIISSISGRELSQGQDIRQYITDEKPSEFILHFTKTRGGEVVHQEYAFEILGNKMWHWLTFAPVYDKDGTLLGVCINGTDITERKKNEAALEKSNERYQLIAKATNDAVYDWDIASGNIQWYEMFYELFNYKPEEIKSTIDWWAQNVHPEDSERTLTSLNQALENKHNNWCEEYRFRCRDGNYKHVYERGYIQYNEMGAPYRMIGSMQNIQQLKEHEFKIYRQNQKLREIAFSQSHLVRKPTANILGLINCFRQEELSPENLKIFRYLEQSAQELDHIIREIVAKANEIHPVPPPTGSGLPGK